VSELTLALLLSTSALADPAATEPPPSIVRPAGGLDFGLGTLIPSIHAPLFHLGMRMGFAYRAQSVPLTGVITGGFGLDAAFTGGSTDSGEYGYLVRLPLTLMLELIHSQRSDTFSKGEWHHHFAVGTGGELAVGAACANGVCNYVPGNTYYDLFGRVGLSYSVAERSSVGLFLTPHFTFASKNVISTVVVSLGWTTF
jgi:hypothetical protein